MADVRSRVPGQGQVGPHGLQGHVVLVGGGRVHGDVGGDGGVDDGGGDVGAVREVLVPGRAVHSELLTELWE